jgi:hypothetical protein
MRLLERNNTGDFRLTRNFHDDKVPPYAILSHTWGDEEVLFQDLCGSFLSLRKGTMYFVHQSAKDFLLGDISDQRSSEASQQTFN